MTWDWVPVSREQPAGVYGLLVCRGTGPVARSDLLVWYQVTEEPSSVSGLGNEELWQCGAPVTLSWGSLWVSVLVSVA